MLKAALRYLDLGYHPVPCPPREKRPKVPWKDYQTTAPTRDQVTQWWTDTPDANVALVLGRGVFAVDLDGGDDAEALLRQAGVELPADAPRSRTGGGYHVLLSAHQPIGDRVALLSVNGGKPQVDIRGVGIIVAPPSVHPSGATYQWLTPPKAETKPPAAPQALLGLLAQAGTAPPQHGQKPPGHANEAGWVARALHGVGAGQRNAMCAKLAGVFLGKGLDQETVTTLLQTGFAARCTPPLPEKEVAATVKSIAAKEAVAGADLAVEAEHLSAILDTLQAQMDRGPAPTVPTFSPTLNYHLNGGMSPGELVFLGARPGVGKTALGLELARAAAIRGVSVLVVSREMTTTALARRLVAQDGRVKASHLKKVEFSPDEGPAFVESIARLKALPIWMTDKVLSVEQLNTLMGQMRHLGLVIVDYLQLMRAPREIRERRHQVEHVSQALKSLALAYRIPVVCLSSLARPQDKSQRPPQLSDLRESGELEHDADVILFLHRDYRAEATDCLVAKNRDGRLGTIKLLFRADYVAFDEAPEQE